MFNNKYVIINNDMKFRLSIINNYFTNIPELEIKVYIKCFGLWIQVGMTNCEGVSSYHYYVYNHKEDVFMRGTKNKYNDVIEICKSLYIEHVKRDDNASKYKKAVKNKFNSLEKVTYVTMKID